MSIENKKKLQDLAYQMERALQVVRTTDKHLPIQAFSALLVIYTNPGVAQHDLGTRLGTGTSLTARTIARLSEWERLNKKGLHLVRQETDPADRRYRLLYLTPEGERLVQTALRALASTQ